jgi:hypothetical protein
LPRGAGQHPAILESSGLDAAQQAARAGSPGRRLAVRLALVYALAWAALPAGVNADSNGYLAESRALLRPGWTTYYPPGYPALLAVLAAQRLVPLPLLTTLLQQAAMVLSAFWAWRALARIVPPSRAAAAVLFSGLLPISVLLGQTVGSEPMAAVATMGAFHFGLRAREGRALCDALAAGVLTGVAGIARVTPLAAAAPAILLMLLLPWRARQLRLALWYCTAAGVVVAVPMVWFLVQSGRFCLANSGVGILYNRVVVELVLLDRGGPATRQLAAIVGEDALRGSEHTEIRTRLEAGMGYEEANALLGRVAREGLASDPAAFAAFTLAQACRQFGLGPELPVGDEHQLGNAELTAAPVLGRWPALENAMRRLRGAESWAWPCLCALALLGAVVLLRSGCVVVGLAWLWLPAGLLLSQALLERSIARYTVPVVPFMAPLAFLAAGSVLSRFRRRQHDPEPRLPMPAP